MFDLSHNKEILFYTTFCYCCCYFHHYSSIVESGIFDLSFSYGMYFFGTFQMMVQRTLAARSLSHAQGGTLFAGYLKIFPVFLLVLPGMISRVLFTGKMARDNYFS